MLLPENYAGSSRKQVDTAFLLLCTDAASRLQSILIVQPTPCDAILLTFAAHQR